MLNPLYIEQVLAHGWKTHVDKCFVKQAMFKTKTNIVLRQTFKVLTEPCNTMLKNERRNGHPNLDINTVINTQTTNH